VEQVTATDFSVRLVNEVMPHVAKALGADESKLTRRVADFHALPFDDRSFDWVVADSALHHGTDVVRVLSEARRVLRPGGRLLAVREPVRPVLAAWQVRARESTVEELSHHGVSEPLYRRGEWNSFFADAGLDVRWFSVSFSRGIRRWLSLASNGLLKADYCIVGTRRP
jgi:SAM-dependent methyltransferase